MTLQSTQFSLVFSQDNSVFCLIQMALSDNYHNGSKSLNKSSSTSRLNVIHTELKGN